MKKTFSFEFEDKSSENKMLFEYDEEIDEILDVSNVDGLCTVYANREAFMALAKVFARLALCEYKKGFHFHIRKNFDGDEDDIIAFTLIE
jgi:hypothetical protein